MTIGFDFCQHLPIFIWFYKNNGEEGHTLIERMSVNEAIAEAEAYLKDGWDCAEAINANDYEVIFCAKVINEDDSDSITFEAISC